MQWRQWRVIYKQFTTAWKVNVQVRWIFPSMSTHNQYSSACTLWCKPLCFQCEYLMPGVCEEEWQVFESWESRLKFWCSSLCLPCQVIGKDEDGELIIFGDMSWVKYTLRKQNWPCEYHCRHLMWTLVASTVWGKDTYLINRVIDDGKQYNVLNDNSLLVVFLANFPLFIDDFLGCGGLLHAIISLECCILFVVYNVGHCF